MLTVFPKQVSNKAVATYITTLVFISIVFWNNVMELKFILIGLLFVLSFFCFSNKLSIEWKNLPSKVFVKKIFYTALTIRVIWVVFSYFFYTANTGQPFEWGAADSIGYHEIAEYFSREKWSSAWEWWNIKSKGVSDLGYQLYLTFIYKIFGPHLMVARLIKAIWSSLTCVLIYRISSRTINEQTGRLAGVFCVLMPNLICYCGIHTKETEMVFCCAMFLERADYLIRSKEYSLINVLLPTLFAFTLFFFRTVLGVVAVFSFYTALLFNTEIVICKGRKLLLAIWMVAAVSVFAGGVIMTEVEHYWNLRVTNEVMKREHQSATAKWAKYATGTVMAPMVFTLPFATMIDTDQQNQNIMHGGAFVKNFLCVFVFFTLFYSLKHKKWRDFSLIGAFVIGYLGVISFSGYANAERFHMPVLPCVLIMAAYGISLLNSNNLKFVNYWSVVVLLTEFAWSFFKLGSRGLVGF